MEQENVSVNRDLISLDVLGDISGQIKILEAIKDGKNIERRQILCISGYNKSYRDWEVWKPSLRDIGNLFSDTTWEYRIKKEPEFKKVPYETIEELLGDMVEHGPMVQLSDTVYNIPKSVIFLDGHPIVDFETPAYKSVTSEELVNFNWQDGKGCYKFVKVED